MMKMILIIAVSIFLSANLHGQTKLTENTIRIDKETKGASAEVSEMAWLAGTWTGNAFGGKVKEVWSDTDGVLMGMFVLVKDKKPVFSEFLSFIVEDGQLFLKLKHFNPDMTGWEEKDKTVDFRYIKKEENRFYFNGLTFENTGTDTLTIYLALHQKDESVNEEVFRMTRVD